LLQRLRGKLTPEGSVIVERSPAASQTSLDVWGPLPQGFGLMQGLKASLDPRGILNPGRFVGGI
jgi:glycolate oxidase FAD binding subunit